VKLGKRLDVCKELIEKINSTLMEDPAVQIGKGLVIANGVHAELDELREIAFNGKA